MTNQEKPGLPIAEIENSPSEVGPSPLHPSNVPLSRGEIEEYLLDLFNAFGWNDILLEKVSADDYLAVIEYGAQNLEDRQWTGGAPSSRGSQGKNTWLYFWVGLSLFSLPGSFYLLFQSFFSN